MSQELPDIRRDTASEIYNAELQEVFVGIVLAAAKNTDRRIGMLKSIGIDLPSGADNRFSQSSAEFNAALADPVVYEILDQRGLI